MHTERSSHQQTDVARILAVDSSDDAPDAGGADDSLEDVAEHERDYLRSRLRAEIGREPTEEELSEWLRRHTEGY